MGSKSANSNKKINEFTWVSSVTRDQISFRGRDIANCGNCYCDSTPVLPSDLAAQGNQGEQASATPKKE